MIEVKHVVIAPVGDKPDALFAGIREFPTEKVVLLSTEKAAENAQAIKKDLERFSIPAYIKEIGKGNLWEQMFIAISEVKNIEKDKELLINVSSGDRTSQCAVTSAAYVNGIKAFSVDNGDVIMLPVLKFSYYHALTEKKRDILKFLYKQKECCSSLEELSRKTKMSLPLISYHINGTLKSDGLKTLGLVETANKKRGVSVALSIMGKLLIKGYVS